jgi:hypothetical protein
VSSTDRRQGRPCSHWEFFFLDFVDFFLLLLRVLLVHVEGLGILLGHVGLAWGTGRRGRTDRGCTGTLHKYKGKIIGNSYLGRLYWLKRSYHSFLGFVFVVMNVLAAMMFSSGLLLNHLSE